MPKVGSFCYEILKSMLHRYDDNKDTSTQKSALKKKSKKAVNSASSDSEMDTDEDDRVEAKIDED